MVNQQINYNIEMKLTGHDDSLANMNLYSIRKQENTINSTIGLMNLTHRKKTVYKVGYLTNVL